jgi:hypothetical protein
VCQFCPNGGETFNEGLQKSVDLAARKPMIQDCGTGLEKDMDYRLKKESKGQTLFAMIYGIDLIGKDFFHVFLPERKKN